MRKNFLFLAIAFVNLLTLKGFSQITFSQPTSANICESTIYTADFFVQSNTFNLNLSAIVYDGMGNAISLPSPYPNCGNGQLGSNPVTAILMDVKSLDPIGCDSAFSDFNLPSLGTNSFSSNVYLHFSCTGNTAIRITYKINLDCSLLSHAPRHDQRQQDQPECDQRETEDFRAERHRRRRRIHQILLELAAGDEALVL